MESKFNNPLPSLRQLEDSYVTLKTIKDFGSRGRGVSYTEVAKHLFISKQLGLEVRVPFDYPGKYPTTPGDQLKMKLDLLSEKGLLIKNEIDEATYYKVSDKGTVILNKLEDILSKSICGYDDKIALLKKLHEEETKSTWRNDKKNDGLECKNCLYRGSPYCWNDCPYNRRRQHENMREDSMKIFGEMTPVEELQEKVVRPLVLNLTEEVQIIYIDPCLKLLERSDIIVPAFRQLSEKDVEQAIKSVSRCVETFGKHEHLNDFMKCERAKKGEIVDFVKKLMFGIEKYNNPGFLGQEGDVVLLYAPLKHEEKGKNGQIYKVGTLYKRRILIRNNTILNVNTDHYREFFILAHVGRNKWRALAVGIPQRFYDELILCGHDHQEEVLERIFLAIRPHLNMWRKNLSLRKLYDSLKIQSEDDPKVAISKIMLWVKKHFKILDLPQVKIDDPFIVLDEVIEEKVRIGYINNCKEMVALLAILLICLPILRRPRVYIQFCTVEGGRDHVRICAKLDDEDALIPLDLDYIPHVKILSSYQIGGKKNGLEYL